MHWSILVLSQWPGQLSSRARLHRANSQHLREDAMEYSVVIIFRPSGWNPFDLLDAPLEIQRLDVLLPAAAEALAEAVALAYNQNAPVGRWAMLAAIPSRQ